MLSVTYKPFMLSVVMLNVAMLSVTYKPFMLNVAMLSVMAPDKDIHVCHCQPLTP
jgi:hypothetical protein